MIECKYMIYCRGESRLRPFRFLKKELDNIVKPILKLNNKLKAIA